MTISIAIMKRIIDDDDDDYDDLLDTVVGNTITDNVITASTMVLTGVFYISSGAHPILSVTTSVVTGMLCSLSGLFFKKKYKWVPKAITLGILIVGCMSNQDKKK